MIKQRRKTVQAVDAVIEATKSLDVFPKIEDDYVETSSSRGTYSILIFVFISVLVIAEVRTFYEKHLEYNYEVDFDFMSKLKLNIDMTVASRCEFIGGDVLDSTSVLLAQRALNMTDTWFDMSPDQLKYFKLVSELNNRIRQNYHALHSSWFRNIPNITLKPPEREIMPTWPKDACRIQGDLELNKVLGIFHVIQGKAINLMGTHAHALNMNPNMNRINSVNFSHRIDNFSFGDNSHLVHNALNYDLKIVKGTQTKFMYFISVVAVEVGEKKAFQYSVTEMEMDATNFMEAGLYFRYDINPIKVKVTSEDKPYMELIIPLIGLIGGIFATSTMLNSIYESVKDYLGQN